MNLHWITEPKHCILLKEYDRELGGTRNCFDEMSAHSRPRWNFINKKEDKMRRKKRKENGYRREPNGRKVTPRRRHQWHVKPCYLDLLSEIYEKFPITVTTTTTIRYLFFVRFVLLRFIYNSVNSFYYLSLTLFTVFHVRKMCTHQSSPARRCEYVYQLSRRNKKHLFETAC